MPNAHAMDDRNDAEQPASRRWLQGCAIGCAVAAFLSALIGALGAVLIANLAGMIGRISAETLAAELALRYDQLKQADRLPEGHEDLFDAVFRASQQEGASMWVVLACTAVIERGVEDGLFTARERVQLEDVLRLAERNRGANEAEVRALTRRFAGLDRRIEQILRRPFTVEGPGPRPRLPAPERRNEQDENRDQLEAPEQHGE